MAHFYVNTIVFLTVQQTIAVPRQRMTQCEQWNNEGLFSQCVAAWRRKKDLYKTKKKKASIIVF